MTQMKGVSQQTNNQVRLQPIDGKKLIVDAGTKRKAMNDERVYEGSHKKE